MLPVLAPEISRQLDDDGFAVFPGLLPSTLAAALAQRFDELAAAEGLGAGAEQHPEPGCVRVADLVNKDELFDVCWTHPVLLAAVVHLLRWRPFKLSAIAARDPLPDGGQQGLHPDWPRPVAPDDSQVCNGIWMLDAFTADNGATRVVPGSHRLDRLPYEDNPDLDAAIRVSCCCAGRQAPSWCSARTCGTGGRATGASSTDAASLHTSCGESSLPCSSSSSALRASPPRNAGSSVFDAIA